MKNSLLKLKNVSKFYYGKGIVSSGFTHVNLEFNLGEFVVITGESGSGKSTLLNVLSGLDTYEEGEMYINGEETSHYGESDFEEYRKTYIGNIFQSFNLVNSYTVYQNIELVLLLNGYKKSEIKNKIIDLIKKVDLYKYRNTKVSKLSGGQKQRVAIARALAKDTPIIIADEPTGNLDSKSAKSVIKLLAEIASDKLVIIVTHNYEQVEQYATRKIEMHDGKVREDLNLKDYKQSDPVIYDYKNISFINKVRLGMRNAINILPKFLLTFIVFLFVIVAFLGMYSGFRRLEYEEGKNGYNGFFMDVDYRRIVIKKKDHNAFADSDYNNISKMEHVKRITKNDALLDSQFILTNEDVYIFGKVLNAKNVKHVDKGRLPEKENEAVVSGYKYNYYLSQGIDLLFNADMDIRTQFDRVISYPEKIKVVGVIYSKDYEEKIYLSDNIIESLKFSINEQYSKLKVTVNNNSFNVQPYDLYMQIRPNKLVRKGEATVSSDMNSYCKYDWCRNQKINIKIHNVYYDEELDLTMTGIYFNYNFESVTGLKSFEDNNGIIFISEEDYNDIYNRGPFQSSVFVDDEKNTSTVAKSLEKEGYKTLVIKNTLTNDFEELLRVIRIVKIIITVVLFVVLFFISYFVIKLIQKSKNIYYSTVRILGGSKKVINNLISIELLFVFHIAYLLYVTLTLLVKKGLLKISIISGTTKFLGVKDFIIIYLMLFVMSYLLSLRYSRKLFKSSAMKAYNEEV